MNCAHVRIIQNKSLNPLNLKGCYNMKIGIENYNILLNQIQKLIADAKHNIGQIVNRQKIETYWKIGKIVDEYLTQLGETGYGEGVFVKLEQDISIKKRALYEMRAFYKAYDEMPSIEKSLNFSHYKILAAVVDVGNRKYLENLVIENALTVRDLKQEVSKANAEKAVNKKTTPVIDNTEKDRELLDFKRGRLFIYKIKEFAHSKQKMIDCGFNIFREIDSDFADGEVVQTTKSNGDYGQEYALSKYAKKSSKLYTYKAYLERVVDGDTIRVILDLGFETQHREILRLSGINAPENKTAAGKRSTQALKKILEGVPFLIIKTNGIDMYGRYIADVFLGLTQDETKDGNSKEEDAQKIADEGIYLSQKILDLGLAQRY